MVQVRSLSRIIGAGLCAIFFISNVLLVHAGEANVWQQRQRQLVQLPAALSSLESIPVLHKQKKHPGHLDPVLSGVVASLPYQYGTTSGLKSHPTSKRKGIVIHIQDVHMNEEAQQNIARSIQTLIDQKAIDLIGLEGAFGDVSLSRFRSFAFPDSVRRVADYLLQTHKVSGAVHTALVSQTAIPPVVGVDHCEAYDRNIRSYREAVPRQAALQSQLAQRVQRHEQKKRNILNPTLKEFDGLVQAYRRNDIKMGVFLRRLSAYKGLSSSQIPTFMEALGLEEKMNFDLVSVQRTRLLKRLVSKLNEPQLQGLLNASVSYRTGQLSHGDFYQFVQELCDAVKLSLSHFPHFHRYVRYVLLSDAIEPDVLFADIRRREKQIFDRLAVSPQEKELVRVSRELYLLGQLLRFELTKEEWEEYGESLKIENSELVPFESFYRQAEIRDQKMTENLIKAIDRTKANVSVLVTGGFHSKGVDARLARAGFSVIPFTPTLTQIEGEDGSSYLSVFTQEKTPLDKLFAGEKLFVPPEVMIHPNGLAKAVGVDAVHHGTISTLAGLIRFLLRMSPEMTVAPSQMKWVRRPNRTSVQMSPAEIWTAHYRSDGAIVSLAALAFPDEIGVDAKDEIDPDIVRNERPPKESWWVLWRTLGGGLLAFGVTLGLSQFLSFSAGTIAFYLVQFSISTLFLLVIWDRFVRKHFVKEGVVVRYPTPDEIEQEIQEGSDSLWAREGKIKPGAMVLRKRPLRRVDRIAIRFSSIWVVIVPQLPFIAWTSAFTYFPAGSLFLFFAFFLVLTPFFFLLTHRISTFVHRFFTERHLKKDGADVVAVLAFPDDVWSNGKSIIEIALFALTPPVLYWFFNYHGDRQRRLRKGFLKRGLIVGFDPPSGKSRAPVRSLDQIPSASARKVEAVVKGGGMAYFGTSNAARNAINHRLRKNLGAPLSSGLILSYAEALQSFNAGARVFFVNEEHEESLVKDIRAHAKKKGQPVLLILSKEMNGVAPDSMQEWVQSARREGFNGVEFRAGEDSSPDVLDQLTVIREIKEETGFMVGLAASARLNELDILRKHLDRGAGRIIDFFRVEARESDDPNTILEQATWFMKKSERDFYEVDVLPVVEGVGVTLITTGIPAAILYWVLQFPFFSFLLPDATIILTLVVLFIVQAIWGQFVARFLTAFHQKRLNRNPGALFETANDLGLLASFGTGVVTLFLYLAGIVSFSLEPFLISMVASFALVHILYHRRFNKSNESENRGALIPLPKPENWELGRLDSALVGFSGEETPSTLERVAPTRLEGRLRRSMRARRAAGKSA